MFISMNAPLIYGPHYKFSLSANLIPRDSPYFGVDREMRISLSVRYYSLRYRITMDYKLSDHFIYDVSKDSNSRLWYQPMIQKGRI